MGKKVRIAAGTVEPDAELNNTGTAQAIWEALPIAGRVNLWGDEAYFSIPVHLDLDAGQELLPGKYHSGGNAIGKRSKG